MAWSVGGWVGWMGGRVTLVAHCSSVSRVRVESRLVGSGSACCLFELAMRQYLPLHCSACPKQLGSLFLPPHQPLIPSLPGSGARICPLPLYTTLAPPPTFPLPISQAASPPHEASTRFHYDKLTPPPHPCLLLRPLPHLLFLARVDHHLVR